MSYSIPSPSLRPLSVLSMCIAAHWRQVNSAAELMVQFTPYGDLV